MATQQEIQNIIIGLRNKFATTGAGGQDRLLQAVAEQARLNGWDPNMVAQAANAVAPNGGWDANRVQQVMAQFQQTNQQQPQYGLEPTLNTLALGGEQALKTIGETQDAVSGIYQRGRDDLKPWMTTGGKANDLQGALSGALGADAQRTAFANYNQSPGVQYAQEEAEKAQLRNAAALGGLGGGNTRAELARIAAGTFAQDFGNQYDRLSPLADRGYGAATTAAGLSGQEAGLRQQSGLTASQIPLSVSQQQAGYQYQTGRDIAQNIGGTSSALANYQNSQGLNQGQAINQQAGNINQLYQLAAQGDSAARAQLASMLAANNNSAMNAQAGVPNSQPMQTNYLGQLGQVAGAVSGAMQGGQNINNPQFNNPSTGYGPNYSVPYQNPNQFNPSMLGGNYNWVGTSGLPRS